MSTPEQHYWERNAQRYDRATLMLNRRFSEMAGAVADAVQTEGTVLEIAAGTGLVTAEAAPGVERYIATDRTEEMLTILRGRLGELPNLEVRVADALDLKLDDESVDVVIMANLLHLLPDPTAALAEVRRVLRPQGRLLAPTFCHGQHALANVASRVLAVTGFPVVTRFRDGALDALIAGSGFVISDARWFSGVLPIRYINAHRR